MKLKDTIDLMLSNDYKERFKAEFHQLDIRRAGLEKMLHDWDNGTLNFVPTCPISTYEYQLDLMEKYSNVLEERAKMEDIDLWR